MTLPWLLLVPRSDYFKEAKIYRLCPEIRGPMNTAAGYKAAGYAALAPVVVAFLVAMPFVLLKQAATKLLGLLPPLPDFSRQHREAIESAHRILSIETIQQRLREAENKGDVQE